MANLKSKKEVWMNALRQTKEYDGRSAWTPSPGFIKAQNDAVKQIIAQQIDEEMEECPLDPVEEAKIEIVDKVTKHFQDMLFEMICEEMGNRYVFQSQEYLTEAGFELFEEEFFEFYHEHHGEILYKVMKNITNE